MSATQLTEETVHRAAPDAQVLQSGRDLLRKKKFMKLGVSADGTWLLGQCQGSGKQPYEVSCDLGAADNPVGRCTCPSRKFPCKHALGLMLAYLAAPDTFGQREPADDLVAKREKQVQRKEKKAEETKAPRKVNVAALAKKTQTQKEGLNLLEKLVVDLVAAGQWHEASRLDQLERQSKQLSDAYLPGALTELRRLVLVGRQQDLPEAERLVCGAAIIARLWATVQKGRNFLDGKLAGGESQAEADAVLEEVLGHAWQLTELRDKGFVRQDLQLFELAHAREDDHGRLERIEASFLLDLKEGGVYRAITYRPFKSLKYVPEQPSYTEPLTVSEAALYPGFPLNRRIRWEKGAEKTELLTPAHLKKVYGLAAPAFETAVAAFRQQLKNLLSPPTGDALLRCKKVGRVGDQVVLEDAQGGRLVARDRLAGQNNVANLVRAAGMLSEPAVLVSLFFEPQHNAIVAQPLAALTEQTHLRLGL
jgi:hypothetical protein